MQIVEHHRRYFNGISLCEEKLPQVPIQEIVNKVQTTVQNEYPAEKKMPSPPVGEPVVSGDGDPAWKRARERPRLGELNAKHTGRVQTVSENFGISTNIAVVLLC